MTLYTWITVKSIYETTVVNNLHNYKIQITTSRKQQITGILIHVVVY